MELLELLDELRIIGQNGVRYADNPYDEERYERLLELVAEYYGETLDVSSGEVRERFADELGHITPKVGAEAAIFNSDGDVLLMRRADTDEWCLPCGWVEPGESPKETAIRETREETGLEVAPTQLINVYHRPPSERFGPHGRISVVYLCERRGGTLTLSHEGTQLEYMDIAAVRNWHKDHKKFAHDAKQAWLQE